MQKSLLSTLIISLSIGLTACGGSSSSSSAATPDGGGVTPGDGASNPGDGNGSNATQVVVDASAGGSGASADNPDNKRSYFSFASGAVVELSDEEAEASNAWDIAFKRTKITLNSNNNAVAAEAALVAAQTDFYNGEDAIKDVFLAATAASEVSHFNAVTSDNLGDTKFVKDGDKAALGTDWYSYNIDTHVISANADNSWIVRTAESDGEAIFNITAITTAGRAAASYTAQFYINQADNGEDFDFPAVATEFVADFSGDKAEVCYDINTQSELDCASNEDAWDVRFTPDFNIWVNGGVHGTGDAGALGPMTHDEADTLTSAAHYSKDSSGGTFTDSDTQWYAYNLNGAHKLWPNYRVYVVKTNAGQYKLRVLSYYAPVDSTEPAAGTSGVITFEYEKL